MRSLLFLLAPCVCCAAEQQQYDLAGLYAYAHIGQAKASDWCADDLGCDNKVTAYGGGIGAQITETIALEASIYSADQLVAVYGSTVFTADVEILAAAAVITIPVAKDWGAQVRLGYGRWDLSVTAQSQSFAAQADVRGYSPIFGAAVAHRITSHVALRAEYLYIPDVGDSLLTGQSNINAITLGFVLSF